jgi:hypothetical protein
VQTLHPKSRDQPLIQTLLSAPATRKQRCGKIFIFVQHSNHIPMNANVSKPLIISALALGAFLLASCAGVEPVQECLTGKQYGFLHRLLHGFITPVSFFVSLLDDNVAIYAVNNRGGWYDLGFLLGSGGWGFLAGNKSKNRS